jgi:hypothetical protein
VIGFLLFVLTWTTLALGLGLVIGAGIHLADTVEQPEADADTERIYVPQEWAA